jgi:hypothetical protein
MENISRTVASEHLVRRLKTTGQRHASGRKARSLPVSECLELHPG